MKTISALVVAHNEEKQLADCLERLKFADEIVVVLDKCTDKSKEIALQFTKRIVEGRWDIEGDRRNRGLAECTMDWVLEVDADERIPAELAAEIRTMINKPTAIGRHLIYVDNYIGETLVRNGWGAAFGTPACERLSLRGVKTWGKHRVHPPVMWTVASGEALKHRIIHYVDKNSADMLKRLNSYAEARSLDMLQYREWTGFYSHIRRFFGRFFKCYISRKGYKEGGYGFLIAVCAGVYPMLSWIKAKEKDPSWPKGVDG
ncbi:MAG: glycosyltransferase family 2 protein [Gammaproteobacteria bacterium]